MLKTPATALHPQPRLPLAPNRLSWPIALSVLLLSLALVYTLIPGTAAAPSGSAGTSVQVAAAGLNSSDTAEREQAIRVLGEAAQAGSREAVTTLAAFFQRDEYLAVNGLATAHAIASAGTRAAYRELIQSFRENPSTTRRHAAMTALEDASPLVTPLLIAALRDSDLGVRSTSAELLGFRHDLVAATALAAATYDAGPTVRAAAVWSLGGDLAVWNALSRIQLLRAEDPDARVRAAAQRAEDRIHGDIARALGIAPTDLLLVSVASANGLIYAATADVLYSIRDSGSWRPVSALPDTPTALAVGGLDGQVAYLGTIGSGLFRSVDGGQHWNQIHSGLPAAERLSVTSLVITAAEADDARLVTMELSAVFGTSALHTTPLGVFQTSDGGGSWVPAVADDAAPE